MRRNRQYRNLKIFVVFFVGTLCLVFHPEEKSHSVEEPASLFNEIGAGKIKQDEKKDIIKEIQRISQTDNIFVLRKKRIEELSVCDIR